MNKLKAKKIKRHTLKTYEFWQLDEKFLLVWPDSKLLGQAGMEALPESKSGYLAYAYLQGPLQIAFLGQANPADSTYTYFDTDAIMAVPAASLPQLLVMPVKPTRELEAHPFVEQVLAAHAGQALERSALALRSLDPLRQPDDPSVLIAAFIRDEAKKQKAYEEKGQEAPKVPDSAITFVRIKDLKPASQGSWRAVLVDRLPGTRLKKKGDDVAISWVTVPGEEGEAVMLFVDHTAPLAGTDIHVTVHRPSRLPWRLAYELACGEGCPYHETFLLGRQGEDSALFKEILDSIRAGQADPLLLIEMVQCEDCQLDFSRELYRCRNCGNLEVMPRLRLISGDKTISSSYSCSQCGERMSQVKRNQIASLDCPECRKPLNLVSEKQWSGPL